jgi:predicted DNA binding CopG/RHH family protein
MRQTNEHIQQFHVSDVKFIRLPFTPYKYHYYMKINGINIRISKDLYQQAQRLTKEVK